MPIAPEFELTFGCGHVGTIDLSALPADRRGGRIAWSFNAAVKVERVNRMRYTTFEEAIRDVVRYIEFRYNRRRLHSALGYLTPRQAYENYINNDAAQSGP